MSHDLHDACLSDACDCQSVTAGMADCVKTAVRQVRLAADLHPQTANVVRLAIPSFKDVGVWLGTSWELL
jgi:hypothetical protein